SNGFGSLGNRKDASELVVLEDFFGCPLGDFENFDFGQKFFLQHIRDNLITRVIHRFNLHARVEGLQDVLLIVNQNLVEFNPAGTCEQLTNDQRLRVQQRIYKVGDV